MTHDNTLARIKSVWHDPVWSKVISSVIVVVLLAIVAWIWQHTSWNWVIAAICAPILILMGFIIGSIVFRRVEDRIKITSPLDGQILDEKEKQPMNTGFSYPVRGTLKNLPTKHRVWLLCVNESFDRVWPQGFSRMKYNPRQGEWEGRVYLGTSQKTLS